MLDKCPGSAGVRTPTLKLRECPECGNEIEIFSNEKKAKCGNCGFTIYNDIASCIEWCQYAKECVGEEKYRQVKKDNK